MEQKLSDAVSRFSQKFRRFMNSEEKEIQKEFNENSLQNEKISLAEKEKTERFRKAVIETYKAVLSPFDVLGSKSLRAVEIDRDKESLLKVYGLYKKLYETNRSSADEETFMERAELRTPLDAKTNYTEGSLFIYLYAWLFFEKGFTEFVPFFEQNENSFYRIQFAEREKFNFDSKKREILDLIESEFYRKSDGNSDRNSDTLTK